VSRYGEEGGRPKNRGRSGSSWWRDLMSIRRGVVTKMSNWFIIVLCERWTMGLQLTFGVIRGWKEVCYVIGLYVCLI
jgi:hypothetical protein